MIAEIYDEISDAIKYAFDKICDEDYISFILFIGRGDVGPGLKSIRGTDCVIDNKLDIYKDRTRETFYLRYLNRNYSKEGFHYQGDLGIDDLSIEMMIYAHLWDSSYFLKSLYRLASILKGEGYKWKAEIPDRKKHEFIIDNIITPLKESGTALGNILEKGYNSDIRNAFAHALYNVDVDSEEIYTWTHLGTRTYKFEDFQKIFLYSVFLMHLLHNALETNHDHACSKNAILTNVFKTPEGIDVQVYATQVKRGDKMYPEFRIVRVSKE